MDFANPLLRKSRVSDTFLARPDILKTMAAPVAYACATVQTGTVPVTSWNANQIPIQSDGGFSCLQNLAVAYGSDQYMRTKQLNALTTYDRLVNTVNNNNTGVRMPTGSPTSGTANGSNSQSTGSRVQSSVQQSYGNSNSSSCNGEQLSKTNLYIRGLKPDTNDKDLVNLCQQYGKIISTKAIIDQTTGKCKGYGFVDYDCEKSAEAAVKALAAAGVQAQMAKQQEQDTTNLYIANLPAFISETDLEKMFEPYGSVISTRILRDNNGFSRGVGFARMESKEKCEQIIQAFNGKLLQGCKEQLTAKFADGGSKKKHYHNSQWIDRQHESLGLHQHYEHLAIAPNGLAPALITSLGAIPRYTTVATSPVNSYHIPSGGWIPYPSGYLFQSPMTSVVPASLHPSMNAPTTVDPVMLPHLSAQLSQLHIAPQQFLSGSSGPQYIHMAFPPPHMQQLAIEDPTSGQTVIDEMHFPHQYSHSLNK